MVVMAMPQHRTWVEVSRSQIAENFRNVRQAVGPGVEVLAVVKAGAYGHGAVEVSRIVAASGARWLAVSDAEEGVLLRKAGIGTRILVMADGLCFEREALLEHQLTPVVHDLEDLAELERFAASRNARAPYHLKLDSGMGRLGTRTGGLEILEAIGRCRHAELEGLMTHFASSADYSSSQTAEQIAAFQRVVEELGAAGVRPRWVHMSSTNPVAYGRREAFGNMVRVGHALYGYVSPAKGDAPKRTLDVQPALSWRARVLAIKDLPAGALVGYGGAYRTERPTKIAVVAAGYADGVPHRLGNRGKVIAAGRLAPVIGAVSMDLTTIDVTEAPHLRPGDTVTLLGREGGAALYAQQVARWAGTISYAVLCGIHPRVPRLYL